MCKKLINYCTFGLTKWSIWVCSWSHILTSWKRGVCCSAWNNKFIYTTCDLRLHLILHGIRITYQIEPIKKAKLAGTWHCSRIYFIWWRKCLSGSLAEALVCEKSTTALKETETRRFVDTKQSQNYSRWLSFIHPFSVKNWVFNLNHSNWNQINSTKQAVCSTYH